MKKVALILFFILASVYAFGQKVVFMPCWIEQAQWAGYYMAEKQGFYKDEGLDVEIVHPARNSTRSAFEMLLSDKVNIISGHLVTALRLRAKGYPISNVLQTSQRSSQCCVTRYRLDSIQQLKSMTIARWKNEFGECFDIINSDYHLGIKWVPYIRDVNLFVCGAVDGILACSYSEYLALQTSIGIIHPKCVIYAKDYGYDFPEDGLFVTNRYLSKNRTTIEKFVRASIRGWEYARRHKDETLEYVLKIMQDKNIQTNVYMQREMLKTVLDLQYNKNSGKFDFAPISIEDYYKMYDNLKRIDNFSYPVKYTDFIKDLRSQE